MVLEKAGQQPMTKLIKTIWNNLKVCHIEPDKTVWLKISLYSDQQLIDYWNMHIVPSHTSETDIVRCKHNYIIKVKFSDKGGG